MNNAASLTQHAFGPKQSAGSFSGLVERLSLGEVAASQLVNYELSFMCHRESSFSVTKTMSEAYKVGSGTCV